MTKTRDMQFSWHGEQWVKAQLEKRGHNVQTTIDYSRRACDMTIDGMPVEVKIAKQTMSIKRRKSGKTVGYPRYKFNCSSIMSTAGEFPIALIAHSPTGANYAHIVPASIIRSRGNSHPEITNHPEKYRGWLRPFLGRWDIVNAIIRDWYIEQGQILMPIAEYQGMCEEAIAV